MTPEQITRFGQHFDELHQTASGLGLNISDDILAALRAAYLAGADYALDIYESHWISVDDELPPRWEDNPNISESVITFGYIGDSSIPCVELQRYHFGDGRWMYSQATHWMLFQYPKKGDQL